MSAIFPANSFTGDPTSNPEWFTYMATVEYCGVKMDFRVGWYDYEGCKTRACAHFMFKHPELDNGVPNMSYRQAREWFEKHGMKITLF